MSQDHTINLTVAAVIRRLASGVTTAATSKPMPFDEAHDLRQGLEHRIPRE